MLDLRRLLLNFASVSAVRAVSGFLSFIVMALIARIWGPERLGEFATLVALFMLLHQMPLLGLHLRVARDIAAYPERTAVVMSNGLVISLTVACLLGPAVAVFGSLFFPRHLLPAFGLVGLSMIPTAFITLSEASLAGQSRMSRIAAVAFVETVLRSGFFAFAVLDGWGISTLFSGFVAFRLLAAGSYWKLADARQFIARRHVSLADLKDFGRDIPVLFAILVLAAVTSRAGLVLLSKLGTLKDVGLYAPADRIAEIFLMVATIATFVWFPVFSRIFASDYHAFRRLCTTVIGTISVLMMPGLAVLAAFATPIIMLVFGESYEQSGPVLRILCAAVALFVVDKMLSAAMLAGKQQGRDLLTQSVTFLVFVAALFALIPNYGGLGLAYGILAAAVTQLGTRTILLRGLLDLGQLLRRFLPNAAAGIAMYALIVNLPAYGWSLYSAVLAGFALYLAALFVSGTIRMGEIRSLLTMLRNR